MLIATVFAQHAYTAYNLFSLLAVFVGLAGVIGAAYAVLRSNLSSQTIKLLKENNEALSQRVDNLEDSLVLKDAIILKQGEEVKLLRDMVTGSSAVDTLSRQVAKNHSEVMAAVRRTQS